MKREDVVQQSEQALQQLVAALQQGRSETLVQYLDMLSRFHRYSFGNCMLIAMQKPDATLVAGFHRWKDLGRFVQKGQHGIAILAPLVYRRKKAKDESAAAEEDETNGRAPNSAGNGKVLGFRVVHVFDVSQTEGQELPQFATVAGDPRDQVVKLEQVIRSHGIELCYEPIPGGAWGISEGGKITVLPTLSAAETFAVLAHEAAHELLHRGDRRQQTTKTVRETEAEAVAYVVCRAAGLDSTTKSADYIQLYAGDPELLLASLELIRDVASSIITELEAVVSDALPQTAQVG